MSADAPVGRSQPPLSYPPYRSNELRAPRQPLVRLPANYTDLSQPVYGHLPLREMDNDLTRQSRRRGARGASFLTRQVTQMYFPNDPLFAYDPIWQSIPDERARQRLIASFDLSLTQPEWALGYRFDIVVRGPNSTPFEERA